MTRFWLVAILTSLLLSACDPASDRKNESSEASKLPASPQQALSGVWQGPCLESQLFGLTEQQVVEIRERDLILTRTFHADVSCKEPMMVVEEVGVLERRDEVVPNTLAVDVEFSSVRTGPASLVGSKLLNGLKACGLSNWQIGVLEEVTGQTGSSFCFEKTPRRIFDLFRVEGNNLYMGKSASGDKSSESLRPSEPDLSFPFVRL